MLFRSAIFTNDDQLANKLRGIVNHGMFVRYYHDLVGVNSRLDSLQAAVLDVKLKRLNDYNVARQSAAAYYSSQFASCNKLIVPQKGKNTSHIFHQYTLRLQHVDRQKVMEYMAEKQIPCAIYYPVPLHMQKAYTSPRYGAGDFPVSEQLCKEVISLPMHTELDKEQLEYITTNFLAAVEKAAL